MTDILRTKAVLISALSLIVLNLGFYMFHCFTRFCRISDGGGAGRPRPPPPIIYEGQS